MKYGTYLKEHAVWAGIFLWLLFSLETFLLTLSGGLWLMLYTAGSLAGAFFVGTYVEYRLRKAYLSALQELTDGLDKKYLVPEMMQEGKRQEEKLLYGIFGSVGKSMYENVAQYKRASREYKEYIEIWIHEVKVPIAAARMILVNRSEADSGLSEEIERVEGYVEQALYYARSNDVEKDYLIKQVKLEKVVEEAVLQKKRELLSQKVSLNMHDLDKMVYSDGKWLSFMIGQALDNSVKYAKEEGLVLELYGEEAKDSTLLYVKDNGIGMKPEEAPRVFDKGFTGTNGRRYRRATGLGLYLCKKLCGRLGHDLLFSTREGEGSVVTFVFPKSRYVDEVRKY